MIKIPREVFLTYVRNFIFGTEDSLVSTVGLLSGIAVADTERKTIVITGIILIFVEAFSMAVGTFLSEQSTEEYQARHKIHIKTTIIAAIIMLGSYSIAGLVPLFPYLMPQIKNPFWISIVFSLIALFILGLVSAEVLKEKIWRNALRMLIIGGLAVGIGVLVGQLLN